jgi:hypothetical protein
MTDAPPPDKSEAPIRVDRDKVVTALAGMPKGERAPEMVTPPTHLGGDLKNIRRCLKDPKPDKAALCATCIAAGTAIYSVLKSSGGHLTVWDLFPFLLAVGAAVVGFMRYRRAAEPDEHRRQAQSDVDDLVAWQEKARAQVDREIKARARLPASSKDALNR